MIKELHCGDPSRRRRARRPTDAPPLFHWLSGALEEVAASLLPGEQLCAFLDDVYLLCDPSRERFLYDLLAAALARVAGIQLHQGKTRAWNRAGVIPDSIDQLRPEVWQPEGITVLGTPIGTEQYVSQKMEERLAKERELWAAIPTVPDLQCAWQLLLQSANPRSNHTMRTMRPSVSAAYCHAHDVGMWETAKTLLDGVPAANEAEMRMGGLGLRSAARCAPTAYWASWADALHMISQRTPDVAHDVLRRLSLEEPIGGCLGEVRDASSELDRKGFWWRPSWPELHEGKRPPKTEIREPGEWPHGWQYWASSVLDTSFRKNSMLTGRPPSRQAHLRTHSGLNAGIVFAHAPTTSECTVHPHLFRVLPLERLNLPLPITEAVCNGCHEPLDAHGRHRAACTRSGRVRKRDRAHVGGGADLWSLPSRQWPME